MKRYRLRILSSRQGEFIVETPKTDGEWVKYEDVKEIIKLASFIVVNKHNFTIGDIDGLATEVIESLDKALG